MDDLSLNGSVFTMQPSSFHVGSQTTVTGGQLLAPDFSAFQVATADPAPTATTDTVGTVSTGNQESIDHQCRTTKFAIVPKMVGNKIDGGIIKKAEGMRNCDAIQLLKTAEAELLQPNCRAKPLLIASIQHALATLLRREEENRPKIERILASFRQTDFRGGQVQFGEAGTAEGRALNGLASRISITAGHDGFGDPRFPRSVGLARAILSQPGQGLEVDVDMLKEVVAQADPWLNPKGETDVDDRGDEIYDRKGYVYGEKDF